MPTHNFFMATSLSPRPPEIGIAGGLGSGDGGGLFSNGLIGAA
jgi:hypothetical protein